MLFVAETAIAQRTLTIERFDATIDVAADGSILVEEVMRARFTGSWNGIFRNIPVQYRTPQGLNYTLRLDVDSATDDAGRPLKYETSRQGHNRQIKIWVPGAQDATRVVKVRYRIENGLRFFDDHDELYWNVTGDEWDVPIDAASARIRLPAGAAGVRAIAFNGVYGSTARDAKVTTEGTTVAVVMPHPLGYHEGLTAVVGWDKGLVAAPTEMDRTLGFLASNWPLAIPIPVFFGMFLLWWRSGRDPRRLPVVVQYEPPESLTPAETGTLMDNSADMRDITATLVDLAVRGYLRIEERDVSALLGLTTRKEFFFRRLDPPAGAAPLEAHESRLLHGIFADGNEVRLSELENEFYQYLPGIKDGIFGRLVERGLYRSRPDSVKGRWIAVAVVLAIGLILFGSTIGVARLNMTPLPFIVGAIVSALVVALFGRIMPARTVAGARTLERVLGFEEFLRRVEGDRLKVVKTPEMFEKFLPFAMAFGVERKWAKAFQDILREPPRWYVGSNVGSFDAGHFTSRMSDLSSRAESAMSSSPRSSGGSGFSGGSSGGGSGGGGGGGF